MRQIILDTESTGLLSEDNSHRLTEICALEMIDYCLTGKKFHSYLNPRREIGCIAKRITGFNYKFLKKKNIFNDIVEEFINFISDSTIIAHNAEFDINFINHELKLINHKIKNIAQSRNIIDTLSMARIMYPGKKNNLNALCKRLSITFHNRKQHTAFKDVYLLSKVYVYMIKHKIRKKSILKIESQKMNNVVIDNKITISIQKKNLLLNSSINEHDANSCYFLYT